MHALVSQRRFAEAERLMTGTDGKQIKPRFRADLNHAWYVLGDIRYKRGRFQSAATAFRRALDIWPDDPAAMMAIANCYSELKRPRWSAYYLEKVVRQEGAKPGILYNLGNAYFDLGDYAKAIETFRAASRSNGGSRELRRMIGKNLSIASVLASR